MLLNLHKVIMHLDGSPLSVDNKVVHLSKALAERLVEKSDGIETLKAYGWAKKLYEKGSIEIDKPDMDKLRNFVESSSLFVFVKGQILEIMDEVETEERKKVKK